VKRPRPLSPWAAAQRRRALEAGGAIVTLRSRGARWTDLAEQFRLADEHAARSLAVGYLLSLTEPHEAAQEAAGEAQRTGVTDAPTESQRVATAAG
jgi:hypothetical protein